VEIISILRVMRRHRWAIAAGLPVAALIAVSMLFSVSLGLPPKLGSKERSSATASARVLISQPDLSTFTLDSDSHQTLPTRAILLADLLMTDVARVEIARDAGIDPAQLTILGPDTGPSPLEITLATEATAAAAAPTGPYLLTAGADGHIPIITLRGFAPDQATAIRLTRAANRTLRRTVAAKSGTLPALVTDRLGAPTAKTVVTGPKKTMAVVAAFLFIVFWTASIIIFFALRARRRPRPEPELPAWLTIDAA
jgi:hypothetical protein